MKSTLILAIVFCTLSVSGQIEPIKKKDARLSPNFPIRVQKAVIDTTTPSVVYVKTENTGRQPAYYINGEISNPSIINTMDYQLIDSMYVKNKEFELNNKKYNGQIFMIMNKGYNPKLISLTDLKKKYTNLTDKQVIFIINDDIVKEDYDQYFVDEKYILRIIVDHVKIEKEQLNVDVIRLLTKTKENIEKSKEIRVRGLNEMTLK